MWLILLSLGFIASRLRSGFGHLGVHLGEIFQPRTCARQRWFAHALVFAFITTYAFLCSPISSVGYALGNLLPRDGRSAILGPESYA